MINTLLHITLFLILLSFGTSPALAQFGMIKGKVVGDNEALSYATVTLGSTSQLTDQFGRFSILLPEGLYTLSASHTGYKKITKEIIIIPGETLSIELVLITDGQLPEVVQVGSRSMIQRSKMNSPVPVDVFTSKDLIKTGQINLMQMLNYSSPSFSSSREILNEPVTLRGLDPHHTLIMINGIRYHSSAWLNGGGLKGQLGKGSAGNDVNGVPFSGVENIEILRDGSSAQYGSDAIACVINVKLKEMTGRTTINFHTGQYYQGDGEKFSFDIHKSMPLNGKGFINVSANFRYQEPTYRGGEYKGTVYTIDTVRDNAMILARGFNRKVVLDNVGNFKITSSGYMVNGAYSLSSRTKLFGTAALNTRTVKRESAYRFPKRQDQVIIELFPDGFQPISDTKSEDLTIIAGVKGTSTSEWKWDLSSSLGGNYIDNRMSNTNNASQLALGKKAPTSFYTGKLIYRQATNNLNISKKISNLPGKFKLINFAMGAEWRIENYETVAGEEGSWENYDASRRTQAGAQGNAGTSPDEVVDETRSSIGIYADLETEIGNFLFDLTGRFEHYSDFGNNISGKLALRYKLTNKFFLRGSAGNGFRAPSLQQRYQISTQTSFVNIGGIRVPSIRGIFPNHHDIVKALHVPSLEPETSTNLSGGFAYTITPHLKLTADIYWIEIRNRIVLSGNFLRNTVNAIDQILDNYPEFDEITQLQFYCNAVNTRTSGIDIVLNGKWKTWKHSDFHMQFAANYNKTKLFGEIISTDLLDDEPSFTNTLFNTEEKTRMEQGQPDSKIILSLNWQFGKTGIHLNNTRFGKTVIAFLDSTGKNYSTESFSAKILTDLSINHQVTPWFMVTCGANNIFDIYPDPIRNYLISGEGIYKYSPEGSPFAFNGGYYFLSVGFSW